MKRRGFTLAETLVSMAISSLVLGAIASLFVIMAKAIPDDSSPLSQANQLTRAIDRFSFDLSWATQVVVGSPEKCEFIIPDCNGDSVDDTVTYQWSTVGGAWTRTLNDEDPETLCDSVKDIQLLWRYRNVNGTTPTKTLESVQLEMTLTNPRSPKVLAKLSAMSHPIIP